FGSAIEGQNQIKAGSFAFAGRTDDFHLAAEFAYPPRDNRQSQSGSARLGRKKWLENFFLHRRRNAYAVVDDGDGQMAAAIRRAGDFHLAVTPTTFNRMQRVEDQIEQDFLERGDLPSAKLRIGLQIGRDGDRALLGFGPGERQHALDNFAQPGRRACDGRRARKTEQLRDGAAQTVDLAGDQIEVARVFATDPFVFA